MFEKLMSFQDSLFWRGIKFVQNILLSVCSLAAVFAIFLTVVMRYIFSSDLYGMEEIILVIAFWLYFVGGSRGSLEDTHIKADLVDVFVKNTRVMYLIKGFAKLVETVVYLLFSKWAISLFFLNLSRMPKTPGLKIPYVVSQFPIALGFVLMCFFAGYYCLLFFSKSATYTLKEN
ncbi:MAG: TRAP transporter small permease subunit [Eubacterium sp.]